MRRDLQREIVSPTNPNPLHTTDLVHPIKDQLFLQDQLPKRISPIPTVIPNRLVGVDLDEDIGNDQRPAKDPTSDNAEDGFVGRKTELSARKERVGQKVATGLPRCATISLG